MSPVTAEPLVGRARELRDAAALLAGVATGRGGLLVVTGEAGIGKTRLAREIAGSALAAGIAVVWGRCVESEGAPAYWPWRQVVRGLGADPEAVFGGAVESPEERFRLVDEVRRLLAERGPLVVVLDDVHVADEASLSLLRHVADGLLDQPLLVVATARDAGPALVELLRAPGADRWELRRLDLGEVEAQLASAEHAAEVHRATGGNPMFVREVARAITVGTWDPQRPPRTVLDAVASRLQRLSLPCRRFLQTAAVVGRDFRLDVVATALGTDEADQLPALDEAVLHGLVEAGPRFVHALTRDAVELSLSHAERREQHRRVAQAVANRYADDLSDHLTDLLRHAQGAGDAPAARDWAVRSAEEAGRRLAFEEAVRLFGVALEVDPRDLRALHGLARSAYYAGDLDTWLDAVRRAAEVSRGTRHLADTALLLEPMPDQGVLVLADQLCREALEHDDLTAGMRARLLALRSHVAFYDGDLPATEERSAQAVRLAREAGDDDAVVAALQARWEALPGPEGLVERALLVDEMLATAQRLGSRRNEMWARLWRVEVRCEQGDFAGAAKGLPELATVVSRVGGPVAAWHLDRVGACVAQAQGRYDEAAALAQRAHDRMAPIEPAPARGAWFAMQVALSAHLGPSDEALSLARVGWQAPPRFVTMGRLSRAALLASAGLLDEARAAYLQAGPVEAWDLPVFFRVGGLVVGVRADLALDRQEDLACLVELLTPLRGLHAVGGGVAYGGPVTLALGRAEAALGDTAAAVSDLRAAVAQAEQAGSPGFAAEARLHLAAQLPAGPERRQLIAQAEQVARALGLTAVLPPAAEDSPLSAREQQVAALVAEGLTNRQIAERLVISERTAQNHVQHVLTKLDLSNRAQIAAWMMSR